MKKKVSVADLRQGMYIAELDRPWLESPFLFQGFFLYTPEEVTEVRKTCRYVYIDTDKVDDSPDNSRDNAGLSLEPDHRELTNVRYELPERRDAPEERVSFENEFKRAQDIQSRIRELIYAMHFDTRMGKSIDAEGTRKLVRELVDSVLRNPDTQLWLTQLRDKDEYTAEHSLSVTVFALVFGRHLGLNADELLELGMGAALHDIGKVRIPLEIMNKQSELDAREYAIMQQHPVLGQGILANTPGISDEMIGIAAYHHETVGGEGYPGGLRRDEIPVYARIVAIVDAYDAMTTYRPYRTQSSSYDSLKQLYELRGVRYDETLVEQFIQCLGIYPVGCVVELQSGEVGVVVSNHKSRRLKPKILMILSKDKHRLTPPRVVDLKVMTQQDAGAYVIKSVLGPDAFKINVRQYIQVSEWFVV